jgi:hypothetical protein
MRSGLQYDISQPASGSSGSLQGHNQTMSACLEESLPASLMFIACQTGLKIELDALYIYKGSNHPADSDAASLRLHPIQTSHTGTEGSGSLGHRHNCIDQLV